MKHLFLDLDNTIFSSRSISFEAIVDFYEFIISLIPERDKYEKNDFYEDFVMLSFPDLLGKYGISLTVFKEEYAKKEFFKGKLNILPYPDYSKVRELPNPKYLVTSGFTDFQWQKINSLGIKKDFSEIIIDDPIYNPIGKTQAFETLIEYFAIDKTNILVIGDNPDSEIRSGTEIGLKTVLIDRRMKYNIKKSGADDLINDFSELKDMLLI